MHCEDEDECLLETFECHGNATCTNIPGGYNCKCPSTMIGDGKDCEESNACDNSDCHMHAECVPKTATTFECKCKEGYVGTIKFFSIFLYIFQGFFVTMSRFSVKIKSFLEILESVFYWY